MFGQALENWYKPLKTAFIRKASEYEVVFVFFSTQPLGRDGWRYVAAQDDLLVVPRQTLPAYLPAVQDRLAVGDLMLSDDEECT